MLDRLTILGIRLYLTVVALLLAALVAVYTPGIATPLDRLMAGGFLAFTALCLIPFVVRNTAQPVGDFLQALTDSAQAAAYALRYPAVLYLAARVASHVGLHPLYGWVALVAYFALICVGAILCGIGLFFWSLFFGPRDGHAPEFLRGTQVLTPDEAYNRSTKLLADNPGPRIFWGGLALPEVVSEGHFLVVGGTGSGKSVSLRLLMQSVLPRIRPGSGIRAVIHDAKKDSMSVLSGMGIASDRIRILNPFDARGYAWDMAADIEDYATAMQFAAILIPEDESHQPYFSNAARDLLGGVFTVFSLLSPGRWTFAEALYAMQHPERLKRVLESTTHTRDLVPLHLSTGDTFKSVQSTIRTKLAMLSPIAALWYSRGDRKMSLKEWAEGEYILLLGKDETLRAPLAALNQALFQRLVQLTLNRPETFTASTWFFLDELQWAGKLELLTDLAAAGRSKGARLVMGFQDLSGLRDVYGEHAANAIAGICSNKAFLRLDSSTTAAWAADIIGEFEQREYMRSFGDDHAGSPRFNESIARRGGALVSELMHWLPADRGRGFYGYFVTPDIGVYRGQVHYAPILRNRGKVSDFELADRSKQLLPDCESALARILAAAQPDDVAAPSHPHSSLDDLPKMKLRVVARQPDPPD